MPTKAELRRVMRERLSLPPDVRAEKSARICRAITALPQWRDAQTVALFAPQPREPDIDQLWSHARGKVVAYPRMEWENLALYAVDTLYDLQPARWDIREPLPANPVSPASVHLVLVPGVAFTRTGARCGRGGGFYDRLLALLPATAYRIGICYSFQLVDELPIEPHDLPVDLVITEETPQVG
jgi:5-formyltetrahydrofolate cyclo-ligase